MMMQPLIEGFSQQLEKAVEIGKNIQLNPVKAEIRNIVVAGLGGSGIGANLVESLVLDQLKVPFYITKTYDIPHFVDQHTLFIASSFSGGTEETLSAVEKALKTGAKVVAVSSGGKLVEMAKTHQFDYVQIPQEAPSPRAYLGYSFVQLLFILHKLGLLEGKFQEELAKSAVLIQKEKENIQKEAKKLSNVFHGRLPIIYADGKLLPVITRLQQQINENAKQLCHINIFPEMNHNELVGWGLGKDAYDHCGVLFVHSDFDNVRVKTRMDICKPIFAEKAAQVAEVKAQGGTFIEQAVYLIHLFDWLSIYLAELNEVDPFPVHIITHLKNELGKV